MRFSHFPLWGRRAGPLFLVLLALSCATPAWCARPVEPEDLNRIVSLSSPAVSNDGKWLAYVASRADARQDINVSHLWLRSWDGARSREVHGPGRHGAWQPSFLPDGRSVAFLSDAGKDGLTQVWVVPVEGGKAHAVTDLPFGVVDYFLAPDGRRLVAVSEISSGGPARADAPIVIDRFLFKDDERGYLSNQRRHLFVVTLADRHATQVTHGDFDAFLPIWSPDGRRIAYVSRHVEQSGNALGYDLYCIDAADGTNERRISSAGRINNDPDHLSRPAWSPDGRSIAYLQGGEERWLEYAPWELYLADVATGATRRVGTADLGYTHPAFSQDGRYLYALVEESRVTTLERIELEGGARERLTSGPRFDFDFAPGPGGRVAMVSGDDLHPFRMSVIDGSGRETLLPGHNDGWLGQVALQLVEEWDAVSADGTRVQGFLVRPAGYQPGKRYPTVLWLHGGPQYQFSHEFQFEWQLFAARGYLVVAMNPRGSSGRGFDFSKAISADWGHVDVQDVLAGLDAAVAAGLADPQRLGVGGWSYGGYLTDFTIASTDRFRAAISGAGSGNALAMYGTDEYTAWLEAEFGPPWKNPEGYLKVSYPFLHADRIRTPTLFFCGQVDFNVPCIGAEQMYQALRSNGVDSRLVIYPGMHHEPDTPGFALDRELRYLDWFDRHLLGR